MYTFCICHIRCWYFSFFLVYAIIPNTAHQPCMVSHSGFNKPLEANPHSWLFLSGIYKSPNKPQYINCIFSEVCGLIKPHSTHSSFLAFSCKILCMVCNINELLSVLTILRKYFWVNYCIIYYSIKSGCFPVNAVIVYLKPH